MEKISSVAGLKNAIQVLEVQQRIKGHELKEQISLTYESLKPVNLIRNTLKDLFSSQYTTENISGAAMGAVSGFLFKKLFIGASANKFRKLVGNVLQFVFTDIHGYPLVAHINDGNNGIAWRNYLAGVRNYLHDLTVQRRFQYQLAVSRLDFVKLAVGGFHLLFCSLVFVRCLVILLFGNGFGIEKIFYAGV